MREKTQIARENFVSCVKAYGKWIEQNAENIVGDEVKTLWCDESIKVSFIVDFESVPTVNIERNHFCMKAIAALLDAKLVEE